MENSDVVALQTVESMKAALASAGPELAPLLQAALEAGEGSEAWEAAEVAIWEAGQ
jgi:hypothetical protein